MNQQLPLKLGWADGYSLDNYFTGGNDQALDSLRRLAAGNGEQFIYLSGAEGAGKSHLLQAVCVEAAHHERAAAYLPLRDAGQYDVRILDGLETLAIVCIDDIDAVARDAVWEEALFDLYNRIREAGGGLVVSALAPPRVVTIGLEDLRSRLAWGLHYHLHELSDDDKSRALQLRARRRGLELPDEAARYLLNRIPRDMNSLFDLLDRLDQASLAAQHRLTIPFIKTLF